MEIKVLKEYLSEMLPTGVVRPKLNRSISYMTLYTFMTFISLIEDLREEKLYIISIDPKDEPIILCRHTPTAVTTTLDIGDLMKLLDTVISSIDMDEPTAYHLRKSFIGLRHNYEAYLEKYALKSSISNLFIFITLLKEIDDPLIFIKSECFVNWERHNL